MGSIMWAPVTVDQRGCSAWSRSGAGRGIDLAPPPRRPSGSCTSPTSTRASSACGAGTRPPWCAWCPTPPSSSAPTRSTSASWVATMASTESECPPPAAPQNPPTPSHHPALPSSACSPCRSPVVCLRFSQTLSPSGTVIPTAPRSVCGEGARHSSTQTDGKERQPREPQNDTHPRDPIAGP